MSKDIILTQGQVAIVDDEDFDRLSKHKWHFCSSTGYTGRRDWRTKTYFLMHRSIMGLEKGDLRQVDHINHNKLDNRKSNLRICTCRQNQENRKHKSPYGTGILYVAKNRHRPFDASVSMDGRRRYLGSFKTAEEACAFRDMVIRERAHTLSKRRSCVK